VKRENRATHKMVKLGNNRFESLTREEQDVLLKIRELKSHIETVEAVYMQLRDNDTSQNKEAQKWKNNEIFNYFRELWLLLLSDAGKLILAKEPDFKASMVKYVKYMETNVLPHLHDFDKKKAADFAALNRKLRLAIL